MSARESKMKKVIKKNPTDRKDGGAKLMSLMMETYGAKMPKKEMNGKSK